MNRKEETEYAHATREEEAEEYSFDHLTGELASGTVSRRKALGLFGVALLGATGFVSLFQSPAEARRKRRRRRRRRVKASPSTVSFGNVTVGQVSTPEDVTVKNISTKPITIAPEISGTDASDFISPTAPITIAPGETKVVPVTFAPSLTGTTGAKTGRLDLVDANNNRIVAKVPLSGIADPLI